MLRKISLIAALLLGTTNIASATNTFVDTNAALKALVGGVTTTAYRTGYYSTGDGGAAIYAWNGASSCTDDGGSCIQPNAGTGRWILNADGAKSVKVFGAHCDADNHDDSTAIQNAIAAAKDVFIPANSTCNMSMAAVSDGLKLGSSTCSAGICGYTHFFGQGPSSVLEFTKSYTPSFDFVTAHQFVNIVVSANVATLTTQWSHQLKPGKTITISGSATTALNGTYTVLGGAGTPSQTASYNTLKFNTSGVANGTYTDPTHITGPSGINVAAIRGFGRDQGGGSSGQWSTFELDHLTIKSNGTANPMTWIDLTGTRASKVHDIEFDLSNDTGAYWDNMQVAVRCADRNPLNWNTGSSCFFAEVNNIATVGGAVTFGWQAPSQDGNNSNALLTRWFLNAEVMGDYNTTQQTNKTTFIQWYVAADGSPLSTDFTGGGPIQSLFTTVGIEGATTLTNDLSNFLQFTTATVNDVVGLPGWQMTPRNFVDLAACPSATATGTVIPVGDSTSATFNAAVAGGGANLVLALCTSGGWKVH